MTTAMIDDNGVLVSFSYEDSEVSPNAVTVGDEFRLEAGKWRWNGSNWVSVTAEAAVPD